MAERGDRLERLGSLFGYLLEAEVPRTRAQIVEHFPFYDSERGRRRFEDDKKALLAAGIPLETTTVAGSPAYIVRAGDYRMPALSLTWPETEALEAAVATVGFDGVPWARMAGAKLDMPGPGAAPVAELPGIEVLPTVEEAVLTRTRLRFRHRDVERTVEPWGVVLKHGRWYLVAWDRVRQAQRCFRLDRVEGASVVVDGEAAAFDRPHDLDLAALVPDDPLTMGDEPSRTATLRVDRRIAPLLTGAPVADDRPIGSEDARGEAPEETPEKMSVLCEIEVCHEPAFVAWVLGWGELVEVTGPDDLRRAVITRLEELAR